MLIATHSASGPLESRFQAGSVWEKTPCTAADLTVESGDAAHSGMAQSGPIVGRRNGAEYEKKLRCQARAIAKRNLADKRHFRERGLRTRKELSAEVRSEMAAQRREATGTNHPRAEAKVKRHRDAAFAALDAPCAAEAKGAPGNDLRPALDDSRPTPNEGDAAARARAHNRAMHSSNGNGRKCFICSSQEHVVQLCPLRKLSPAERQKRLSKMATAAAIENAVNQVNEIRVRRMDKEKESVRESMDDSEAQAAAAEDAAVDKINEMVDELEEQVSRLGPTTSDAPPKKPAATGDKAPPPQRPKRPVIAAPLDGVRMTIEEADDYLRYCYPEAMQGACAAWYETGSLYRALTEERASWARTISLTYRVVTKGEDRRLIEDLKQDAEDRDFVLGTWTFTRPIAEELPWLGRKLEAFQISPKMRECTVVFAPHLLTHAVRQLRCDRRGRAVESVEVAHLNTRARLMRLPTFPCPDTMVQAITDGTELAAMAIAYAGLNEWRGPGPLRPGDRAFSSESGPRPESASASPPPSPGARDMPVDTAPGRPRYPNPTRSLDVTSALGRSARYVSGAVISACSMALQFLATRLFLLTAIILLSKFAGSRSGCSGIFHNMILRSLTVLAISYGTGSLRTLARWWYPLLRSGWPPLRTTRQGRANSLPLWIRSEINSPPSTNDHESTPSVNSSLTQSSRRCAGLTPARMNLRFFLGGFSKLLRMSCTRIRGSSSTSQSQTAQQPLQPSGEGASATTKMTSQPSKVTSLPRLWKLASASCMLTALLITHSTQPSSILRSPEKIAFLLLLGSELKSELGACLATCARRWVMGSQT